MARPGGAHSFASQRFLRALRGNNVIDGGTGWWIEVAREIVIGDRLYVPDLSGWRLGPDDPVPPAFFDQNPVLVVPDWACEILSRSNQKGDRATKLPVYAGNGVGHVWVVDPEARSVELDEARDGVPCLVVGATGDAKRVLPPFPEEIDAGSLWPPTRNGKDPR